MVLVTSALTFFVTLSSALSEDFRLLTIPPTSINVSVGTTVMVTCQGIDSTQIAILLSIPSQTTGSGNERTVTFIATAEANETIIVCIASNATDPSDTETAFATLLVQGPPAGVSNLGVEYEDVCCTLITWDDPYTLSGVPITGYSITVNNMSTSPDTGTPSNMLCLTGPGSYVVTVTALIMNDAGTIAGDVAQVIADIPEVEYKLIASVSSLVQTMLTVMVTIKTSGQCNSAVISSINISNATEEIISISDNITDKMNISNQILATFCADESIIPLNMHLNVSATVSYSNGLTVQTTRSSLSTFDVQAVNYSISSVGVVCVECELVPGTQAQGCHVILDCHNGDVIVQDFIRSDLLASGCLPTTPITPTFCTLLIYDVEKNNALSTDPAIVLDEMLLLEIAYTSFSSQPPPFISSYRTPTPTSAPSNSDTASTEVVFISAAVSVIVLQTMIIIVLLVLLTVSLCWYKRTVLQLNTTIKQMTTSNSQANPVYENMKAPAGIEMQECPAYATFPKT